MSDIPKLMDKNDKGRPPIISGDVRHPQKKDILEKDVLGGMIGGWQLFWR